MLPWVPATLQDLRYTARGLARSPLFTLTAVLAMALGIGASAAVFSVVDRILFRPLPYVDENRLVSVGMLAPLDANEFMFASEYFDLRRAPGPFAAVTSFQAGAIGCDLTEQTPRRLRCLRTEGNFLATLGLTPARGRAFSAEEDRPNGPAVAMISYGLWRSRFAGNEQISGHTMLLDGVPTVIVGVLPERFETPTLTRADVVLPEALNEATEREGRALRVFGRLRPDVSFTQAIAQLQPHFARALETVPPQFRREVRLQVRPVRERQVGEARTTALALFGAVLAVLLIACANLANLLLARGATRERELAVRSALGASRWRLARQALTESLVLSSLGGVSGCALAYALLRAFVAIAPSGLPRLEEASLDGRVLLFALGAAVASGLLFGMAPALRAAETSHLGGARSTGTARGGLRSLLVAGQIAVGLMLLTGAGLLLRSLWQIERVPLGLQTDHVLTAQFVLGKQRYSRDVEQLSFFRELEQRLAHLPGVDAAAISDSVPPSGGTRGRPLSAIAVEGRERRPEGTGGMVAWRYITPSYFAAFGIPLKRGRLFTEQDRDPQAFPVILSERLARQLFGNEEPVGKRILRDPPGPWFTVVGVVGDVRNSGPTRESAPEYYLLRKAVPDVVFRNQEPQSGWRAATVIARTGVSPQLVAQSMRTAIGQLDPTVPVEIQTMDQRLEEVAARPRFQAVLLSTFAGTGVLLAAVGLFGVLAFLVAQRRREIGIRMAVGATPRQILQTTLAQAGRWTAAGLLTGLAGAVIVTRALRSLLFQVEPLDPVVWGLAVLAVCGVALLAGAGPAMRAARLDPMVALREE